MPRSQHYVAAPGATCADLAAHVAAAGCGATPTVERARRTLLDSADRRLRRAGLYLLCDAGPLGCSLLLHDCDGRPCAPPLAMAQAPLTAADLPDRAAREQVAAILAPRTLVAVRSCALERITLGCRDDDAKLLGDLVFASHVDATSPDAPATVTLSAWPRRGYRAELAARLAAGLAAMPLTALDGTVGALLDAVLPPSAAELPRRTPPRPTPDATTVAALAAQLDHYRTLMRDNEAGIRAGLDTEHLHDFRVALRRARTLHGALAGKTLPGGPGHEFAWLSSVTSRLRDLDVWCLQLTDAGDDDELAAALDRERAREHDQLVRVLDGARYAAFQAGWADWIEHAANAADPRRLGATVDQALARRYARLRRRLGAAGGTSLDYPTLHAVRKDAKKLRYLLDAYATLYPGRHVEALLKPLKRLQSCAGALCDRHAHAALLEAWIRVARSARLRATLEAALAELRPSPLIDLAAPGSARLVAALADIDAAARVVKRLSRRHRR
ncbi:MAG: CHAD domain-containing protein [Gammaproteobacteria bacterium]|nr:CHAD domain-containing protein [Gammaproteobacteria bacterium]MCP5200706.1 CHAD domain-containing protein [Gammaproteobacteria bacterium]